MNPHDQKRIFGEQTGYVCNSTSSKLLAACWEECWGVSVWQMHVRAINENICRAFQFYDKISWMQYRPDGNPVAVAVQKCYCCY